MSAWPPWACPLDGERLDGEAELRCIRGHSFANRDGIPRFTESGYSAAFGAQWLRYRRTQLDSCSGTTISEERARRCLGERLWEELEDRQVLECGCGAGRFTEVLLGRAAYVTSVDLSAAVEANQENFPQSGRHRIAQADIRTLPFPPRSYDLVFCLGVVQHTPDPEETIVALSEQVRAGGWLIFDHYSHRVRWMLSSAPLFRAYMKRLPPERGLRTSERLVNALLPLHRRGGRFGTLVRRVSPVQAYYDKLHLGEDAQREWALLDTHDALTDRYKHFRTAPEIEAVLRCVGFEEIWLNEGGNGIEARARRPLA
jgi:SAM-dependent methyltransferase